MSTAVTVVGDEEGVAATRHVVSPSPDHLQHGVGELRAGWTRPCATYQLTADRQVPGPEVVEGEALGRVTLAQVVCERPDILGVTSGQGLQRSAGADGAQLAEIATATSFDPDDSTAASSLPTSASEVMAPSSRTSTWRGLRVRRRARGGG